MTHVTIYRNKKNQCVGFTALGHAGYADEGEDIVCAGISMLIMNTCNSIEALTSAKYKVVSNDDEGLIDFRLKEDPSSETELLLSALILGLKSLADDPNYNEYIHLIFEEV